MADLAKYGEVRYLGGWNDHDTTDRVNILLKEGWEIVTVKIVEVSKRGEAHYILGKRRDPRTPEEIEWKRRMLEDLERSRQ